jgi:hypothetical protein
MKSLSILQFQEDDLGQRYVEPERIAGGSLETTTMDREICQISCEEDHANRRRILKYDVEGKGRRSVCLNDICDGYVHTYADMGRTRLHELQWMPKM